MKDVKYSEKNDKKLLTHFTEEVKEKSSPPKLYIEVKDNGPGIHPKILMETLTSFGSSY